MINTVLRLGVTGLSRAGKTAFITSFVNNLLNIQNLMFFNPSLQSRVRAVYLEPSPDEDISRFTYERNLITLDEGSAWPESTTSISKLRLTIEYEAEHFVFRQLGTQKLHIDIIDYPGEWLLDLPLLNISYEQWSEHSLKVALSPERQEQSQIWYNFIGQIRATDKFDEYKIEQASELYKDYLKALRKKNHGFSEMSPGRFLMPGDLEGAPAVTFTPLIKDGDQEFDDQSYWYLMERRFEAYKDKVIKPFFQNHFVSLDRQVVLVDVLNAVNGGKDVLNDLKATLSSVLACFNTGHNSWISRLWTRRVDRIAFASTKADQLHHTSHDRMTDIMNLLMKDAIEKVSYDGAASEAFALASIRSTREGYVKQSGNELPCILGRPEDGEKVHEEIFDGKREVAIFPGDLPLNAWEVFKQDRTNDQIQIVNFLPPKLPKTEYTEDLVIPHIRLDRVIEYLVGDKFL